MNSTATTTTPTIATPDVPAAIADLEAAFHGRLLRPDHPDYDAARVVTDGSVDKHPALIARVADPADVQAVIAFARRTGLELAVRSGGHDGAGSSTTDGGVVIDLRDMRALEIDPATQTAWVETGLTALDVATAAGEHGLAIGFGDTGSVGIGGITLGGGVGYLVRRTGLTIDNLLAAEVVTADGQVLLTDAANHPDLFWAIRGGGGNFGVATRFRFRLTPLPHFTGGMLVLPGTPETIAGFIAAAEAAPEALSTIANVMPAPPMPFLAPEHHGQIVILAMLGWSGDDEAGKAAIAPFRALAEPLADFVQPMPYPQMFPPEDAAYRPRAVVHPMFVDRVDLAAARTIVDALEASDAPLRAVQLRVLGGAMARVPADATAFAHRDQPIMAQVVSFFGGPEDRPKRVQWVKDLAAAVRPGEHGAYVNFLGHGEEDRVRAAYPSATWDRLVAIKTRYDPTNLFRGNRNIPPRRGE
jgi:hypothetical protein